MEQFKGESSINIYLWGYLMGKQWEYVKNVNCPLVLTVCH